MAQPKPVYKVGDVVRLNSGSPSLNIAAVEGDHVTLVYMKYGSNEFI